MYNENIAPGNYLKRCFFCFVKISEAETEGKIMTQMKELIEKGRMQFAEELKSILPNVDLTAKGKKLTEDELNALIAHAHLRVDQLR